MFDLIIVFIFGLMMGSFLNVLVVRVDELETVVKGRSHCPKCKKILKWYELIPLFSFLLLKARCGKCKEKISWQYPIMELATGLSFVAVYNYVINQSLPKGWEIGSVAFYLIIVCVLILLFMYDFTKMIVPDEFVYPAIGLAIVFQCLAIYFIPNYRLGWMDLVYGLLIGAGVPALLSVPSRGKWMGYGDISIGALMGLVLGYPLVIAGMFMAFCSGGLIGSLLLLSKKKKMTSAVPFGPFLTASTLVALIWGDYLINWYLSFFLLRY